MTENSVFTLWDLKQTDWFKNSPGIIQEAVCKRPPMELYRIKESGKQCLIYSFEEPESGKLEDVTCTVHKTGVGGAMAGMGLGLFDTNRVSGLKLDDIEPWVDYFPNSNITSSSE